MANARENQFVFEAVVLSEPDARVSQFVLELASLPAPPVISCNNPPPGAIHVPYTHAFLASSGLPPYVYSISSGTLPPGIVLNGATGVAAGTPTAGGLYNFVVTVTDANLNSASVGCSILIAGGIIKITFRGVKWVKACPQEAKASDVPSLPPVKRAV